MILRETERILQLAAACEDLADGHAEVDWIRGVAAGAPDGIFAILEDFDHRIVHAGLDPAVVKQEMIGQRVKPRPSVFITADNGFLARVAAGHNEGFEMLDAVEKQVMQRRVRQHYSKARVSRSNTGCNLRIASSLQEDDRPARILEQLALGWVDAAKALGGRDVTDHDGESFAAATFSGSQEIDGRFVRSVAGEMKTAEAFDGDDFSALQQASRMVENRSGIAGRSGEIAP